jgi:hypothetical protein
MARSERITTTEALQLAKERGFILTLPTLIRWCRTTNGGMQMHPRGHWYVNKDKFLNMLRGRS